MFKKAEGFETPLNPSEYALTNPSEKYHGRNGEWKISYSSYFHEMSTYFVRATEAMGIQFNPDFNAESTLGVGRIQTFIDANSCQRSTTERAFLPPEVRERKNLTIITGAKCIRLVIKDGTCTGAVVLHQDQEITFTAKHQVVLSCGAFDSPRILSASNIPLPGIGKNLQDHLGINCSFKIPATFDPTIKTVDSYNGSLGYAQMLYQYLMHKTGPAASNLGEAVAFYRSQLPQILNEDASAGPDAPHIELIAGPLLTHHHEGQRSPAHVRTRLDYDWSQHEWNGRYITIVPLLMNPYSRGELRFKDGGMEIDPNYLSDKRDLEVMIEAVKFVRKIVEEGYARVGVEGMEANHPSNRVQTDEDFAAYIRDNAETYYHPVGTCKVR
jgi:choline dehydrogenase